MKKILICLAGIILFVSGSYSIGFNSVFSKDGVFVIAVGDAGNLFMSYDGGTTFGSYPLAGFNFNSVYQINQKIWIVGDAGAVQVSTNSGSNFSNFAINGADLNSVYFINENTGWAAGNGGRIVKTTNGGSVWFQQSTPNSENLRGIKFVNNNEGYACGDNGTIFFTINSGASWQLYPTGTDIDFLSTDASGGTLVITAEDGIIGVFNGTEITVYDYKFLSKSDVRSVSMLSPSVFYTCGGGGFINKTTDAGATRTYQPNPMMGPLSDIYFFDALKGWAVSSSNAAIMRTIDGGASWQFQSGVSVSYSYSLKQATTGNIGNPFCLHPSNKNGMFILAGNKLYRSLDKGESWTILNGAVPGASCHSFFVNRLDTNLMIASMGSSGGRVIKSTDYGATWVNVINPVNLTSYGMPLEADPNSPNTIYLAPDDDALKKSTDWGTTWTSLGGGEPGGKFRSPCDVVIQHENPNVIFIADGTTGAGNGKFWKTTNAGATWTLINTVVGSEIPMIANTPLDLNLVYHSSWHTGSFWKSSNMGSTFSDLSRTGQLWACEVAKDDPAAIAYNEYGSGNSYISLDGGASFTPPLFVGSQPGAGIMFYDKSTLLFQHSQQTGQTGGIYKLNVNYNVVPVTGVGSSNQVPKQYALGQNYPNPFNPSTVIRFSIPKSEAGKSYTKLSVYDAAGRLVGILVNEHLISGIYTVEFNAPYLSSGVYYYTLTVEDPSLKGLRFKDTKKMMLLK